MTSLKNKVMNAKDKVVGEVKESVGKATGNEELELKGKVQSAKSDIKEKAYDAGNKAKEMKKEVIAEINNMVDENKETNSK